MSPSIDMKVHVHGPDGKTEPVDVDVPPGKPTGTFLDELREQFNLGSRVRWRLYNRDSESLDLRKTLAENGVRAGHELYIRKEEEPRRDPELDSKSRPRPPEPPSPGGKVLVRCDNAHYYDPKKYKTCPYCEERGRKGR